VYDNRRQCSSGDRGQSRETLRSERTGYRVGQALVEEALRLGAQRVYAGTRQPLTLEVSDAAQIREAVDGAEVVPLLDQ
jgi:hypothetical protein